MQIYLSIIIYVYMTVDRMLMVMALLIFFYLIVRESQLLLKMDGQLMRLKEGGIGITFEYISQ